MRRWLAPSVIGMVLLYTALALGAAGCIFMRGEEPEHAHHAPSHAEHSLFCAWACQVTPTVGIHASAPPLAVFVFVLMQRLVDTSSQGRLIRLVSRSRAPPR